MKLSDLDKIEQDALFWNLRTLSSSHSNRIEGIDLDPSQTHTLLEYGKCSEMSLWWHLVVLGHARAFDEAWEAGRSQIPPNSNFVRDLHAMLFGCAYAVTPAFVSRPIGAFRSSEVAISGTQTKVASPKEIAAALDEIFQKEPANIAEIAEFHIKFERIHPFIDGNGRVGRLLMVTQCVACDILPPLITFEQRAQYMEAFEAGGEKMAEFLALCQEQTAELV